MKRISKIDIDKQIAEIIMSYYSMKSNIEIVSLTPEAESWKIISTSILSCPDLDPYFRLSQDHNDEQYR